MRVLPPMLLVEGAPMRVVPSAAGPEDPNRARVGAACTCNMLSVRHPVGHGA